MGEEKLASFFLKVQAVEESFLLLDPAERGRALNILQSSVNKLLNFSGSDGCSAQFGPTQSRNDVACSSLSGNQSSVIEPAQRESLDRGCVRAADNMNSGVSKNRRRRKSVSQARRRVGSGKQSTPFSNNGVADSSCAVLACEPDSQCQSSDMQKAKVASQDQVPSSSGQSLESKEHFEDEFQELASFDCAYDFSQNLAQNTNCPVPATVSSHLPHCTPKYSDTMLNIPTPLDGGACSRTQAHFATPIVNTASAPHGPNEAGCGISNSHPQYGTVLPPTTQATCELTHPQYAGAVVSIPTVHTTGSTSQYAVAVLDVSATQAIPACSAHQEHAQYAGTIFTMPQHLASCASAHYSGQVLNMALSEGSRYSSAHYSGTILHGTSCEAAAHQQFESSVLDMSTAASTQCEGSLTQSHAQFSGTNFDMSSGSHVGASCSAVHYRGAVFDPAAHAVFGQGREVSQVMVSTSAHLHHLQHQHHLATGRWRVFVCRGCGEMLTHYRSVKAHVLGHGSSPVSCRFCRQELVNEVAFMHHLCTGLQWKEIAFLSKEIYMCDECGKTFTSKGGLKSHIRTIHQQQIPENVKLTCRFCGLQFNNRHLLFVHYRQHTGGRFVCCTCGAMLNDFVQYAWHMCNHEKRRKKFHCKHCQKTFRQRIPFKQHPCMLHKQSKGASLKTQCYDYRNTLVKYQAKMAGRSKKSSDTCRTASKGEVLRCGFCHKQFAQPKQLELHTRLHTGEKPVQCTLCSISFRTPKALAKHHQTMGHRQRAGKSDERLYLCSECGKSYFRRPALQRHLRHHRNSKPFACQYCNFRCSEQDNLRSHTARHFSTERNFICELCGAAFHAKKTLEMHHSYKHSSERRFKCPDCPMSFKARNALARHAKVHSRTKEHGCWCGAAFNRLYNLRRHMRLVHGNDEALPPVRKVEVLDSNQSVKQPVSTPPAKKMLVKSRKVKADCLQEEQKAAAAAVVVGGEEEEQRVEGGVEVGVMDNDGMHLLSQVAMSMPAHDLQQQAVALEGVGAYPSLSSTPSGGGVGQPHEAVHHPLSHPHLAMDAHYAMVSSNLHPHHHDPQQTLGATASGAEPAHPLSHLSHHSLEYGQLQALPAMVPYTTANTSTAAPGMVDANVQRQHDFYVPGSGGAGAGMDGLPQQQQQQASGDFTNTFSFIQNFLLPSVGVANLMDLAHASGAK